MSTKKSQNLPFVPEWLARKINDWIGRRNHNNFTKYKITRHNIYILPSKSGWLFILTLIAILSGAINYNNSMAYLLCFFLASLGFIAMLQTHQNLNGIIISSAHSSSVYCGRAVEFNFNVSTKDHQHHFAICTENNKSFSVKDDFTSEFFITETSKKRGRKNPDRFKIYTEFPLGLFYAWTQVKINNPVIIYPKPVKYSSIATSFFAGNKQKENLTGDDDYSGIREFKKGDSPKKLAWKAIAKTNQLYTKEFHTESGDYLIFDFDQLNHITNTEEKLSILCGLILNASKEKSTYGLKLPDKNIKPDHGDLHKHKCLSLLALYKA